MSKCPTKWKLELNISPAHEIQLLSSGLTKQVTIN